MSAVEALAPAPSAAAAIPAKRRLILDAARDLFMAHGYGAVAMDAIAREARVSKATLYAHFGAKDRLFAAIIEEGCAAMRASAGADVAAHAGSPRAALAAMGRDWLGYLLRPGALAIFRVVVAEGVRFPELARVFDLNGPRATRAWLTEWVASQTAAGRLRTADPARAAEQFLSMMRGDLYVRAVLGLGVVEEVEIGATVDAAVDSFLRAYAV